MRKNIIGAAFGMGLLLAAVAPAFAAYDCENNTTGANSSNYCTILAKKKIKFLLINLAKVKNNVNNTTNTGANQQNMNTQAGVNGILTGDANATTNVTNWVNENNLTLNQSGCNGCDASASGNNTLTGYNSTNNVSINVSKKIKLAIINAAKVTNNVNSSADTGHNEQNENTIAGDLFTGNATSNTTVNNTVNTNTVVITQ